MDLIDKLFLINLDERTERLEHFYNQCNIHSIQFDKIERFSAINGTTHVFTEEELKMFKNAEFNVKLLTPFIIKKKLMANQLSHFNILLEMKKRNYNYIIIMQDDVVLKKNFTDYIDLIMQDIPLNAEIINIGMHYTAINHEFEPYDLDSGMVDNDIIDKKVTKFVYQYKTWNTKTGYLVNPASLAYIVTKKGCEKLIDYFYNNGFNYSTDWNYNLYLIGNNIFYGSKFVLATGNIHFKSDIFVNTNEYLLEDLIDTNLYYTDKNTTHSYFDLYNKLFAPIRNEAKNILEIGIGNFDIKNGGSILLWKMYFQNATIHAADKLSEDRVFDIILKDEKIKTYCNSDAYNIDFVKPFNENNILFDVIIDDGTHTLESQCKCIEIYSKLLTSNGILVIEDVQDISWIEKLKQITPYHLQKYIHIYDLRHIKNRYDDILFVINKNIPNESHIDNIDFDNLDIPLVISYENDISNKNSELFKKTMEKNNWQHMFTGQGSKWNGFRDRINGYYKELELLNDNKIVVLSDARDVFCLKKPDFFIQNIKDIINTQIIISSELFLASHINWTDKQISNALAKDPFKFFQGIPLDNYWKFYKKQDDLPYRKYLNAGLIIGKASLLKKAFKWLIDNNFEDDQLGFCNYANQFPELVYLDYDANFLHTSTGFVNGSLYNHNIQLKDTPSFVELCGLSTFFLHIPGINGSLGQKYIYNFLYEVFNKNMLDKSMFEVYNISPERKTCIFESNDC